MSPVRGQEGALPLAPFVSTHTFKGACCQVGHTCCRSALCIASPSGHPGPHGCCLPPGTMRPAQQAADQGQALPFPTSAATAVGLGVDGGLSEQGGEGMISHVLLEPLVHGWMTFPAFPSETVRVSSLVAS